MSRAILVGGSRGIGLEILLALLNETDYSVRVLGRSRPVIPEALAGRWDFSECDLAQGATSIGPAIDRARSTPYQDPDLLIYNSGVGQFAPVEQLPVEAWERIISLNLTAPFMFMRAFVSGMKTRKAGRVIFISSDADGEGFAGGSAYCASKFGLRGMVSAVRKELVAQGVSVTLVSPGRVDTYFNGKAPGARPTALRPSQVAEAVLAVVRASPDVDIELLRMRSTLE